MKLGLAQVNTTVGDFAGNLALILTAYERGVSSGAELVLAPQSGGVDGAGAIGGRGGPSGGARGH